MDEFAFGSFDAIVSDVGGVVIWSKVGIEVGDVSDISRIGIIGDEMLIDDKNDLKILEGLGCETFNDIVHILVSPGRDDDG